MTVNPKLVAEAAKHQNAATRLETAAKRGQMAKVAAEVEVCAAALGNIQGLLKPAAVPAEPQPRPGPPAPTDGWVRSDSIPAIPRGLDLQRFLQPSGKGNAIIAPELAAMRIDQPAVAISHVDPFFRVERGVHCHTQYNRSRIPASGNYADLIVSNNSVGEGQLINASSYLASSLMFEDMDGRLHVAVDRYSIFYYKRKLLTDTFWARNPRIRMADLPRGLKALGGIRHYWRDAWNQWPGEIPCRYSLRQGPVSNSQEVPGAPKTWQLEAILPYVRPGMHIQTNIDFPSMAVPGFIDSPNHADHLSYAGTDEHTDHLPELSMHAMSTVPDFPIRRIFCSGDVVDGKLVHEPGRHTHAYFWEGWEDSIRERIHRSVFDKGMDGNNGNLQDGWALKGRDRSVDALRPLTVPYDRVAAAPGGEFNLIGLK